MNSVPSFEELKRCMICPRKCGVDRYSDIPGYCNCNAGFNVASICIHTGEEPVISGKNGICNVFFPGCNMQCIYCQNYQISRNAECFSGKIQSLEKIVSAICSILDKNIPLLGFVSPTHYLPQVRAIVAAVKNAGKNPAVVYNSNGYDLPEILRTVEGMVDVYLPDFKYITDADGTGFSDTPGYPAVAVAALKEMYYQKGSTVVLNEQGYAISGLIIRHLVLPGKTKESIRLLETIAEELSTSVWISLMSQYHPTPDVKNHKLLGRPVTKTEYQQVVEAMEKIGFHHGWVQEHDSVATYNPDFRNAHPFESTTL